MKMGVIPKATFFDRPAVLRAVDAKTRRVLSQYGAFTRRTARRSLRKRKGASAPGNPPHTHEGSLKRLIFFSYDARRRSVVIGPVPFGDGRAPSLLEHGGTTTLRNAMIPVEVRDRRTGVTKRVFRRYTGRATYAPRPFMGPAGEAELRNPKIAAMWRDSIKGGR